MPISNSVRWHHEILLKTCLVRPKSQQKPLIQQFVLADVGPAISAAFRVGPVRSSPLPRVSVSEREEERSTRATKLEDRF